MDTNKKIKLLDFKLTKTLWNTLFWVYKSKFSWNWIDFVEHKDYVFWDPIKNIDWKTFARTQNIHTKIYEEEKDLKVLFLIDYNKNMDFWIYDRTKKDILEEIFYSLSFSSYHSNDSIWAYIYWLKEKIFFPFKKWIWNIFQVLKTINSEKLNREIDKNRTNKILLDIIKTNLRDNLIFILSDDLDLIDEKVLKILSINNQIIFINIFDDFENNLVKFSGDISLSDWKSFSLVSLSNDKKINEYKKIRQNKILNFQNSLKKNKISYLLLDTKKDIFKELYLFLSKLN